MVRSCLVEHDCYYLIQNYSAWDVLKEVVREWTFSDNLPGHMWETGGNFCLTYNGGTIWNLRSRPEMLSYVKVGM